MVNEFDLLLPSTEAQIGQIAAGTQPVNPDPGEPWAYAANHPAEAGAFLFASVAAGLFIRSMLGHK